MKNKEWTFLDGAHRIASLLSADHIFESLCVELETKPGNVQKFLFIGFMDMTEACMYSSHRFTSSCSREFTVNAENGSHLGIVFDGRQEDQLLTLKLKYDDDYLPVEVELFCVFVSIV
jgi:hypothetical protein